MNRKQKREAFKAGALIAAPAVHAHYIHKDEARKMLHECLTKGVNDYSAVVALCLRDKLGFGHARASKFLEAIGEMFNDIQDGRLTIEDIKKQLNEEIGVIIG